jgi:hypothetical protein
VTDIALQLESKHGERMTFIHEEVYVGNQGDKGLRPQLRAVCRRSRGSSPSIVRAVWPHGLRARLA